MPFILLAEHQSTGGYPRVLEVVSSAKSLLAQAGPGSKIVFKLVNTEQAESLQKKSQGFIAVLSESIRTKLRS
jgi:antagonist of KipI